MLDSLNSPPSVLFCQFHFRFQFQIPPLEIILSAVLLFLFLFCCYCCCATVVPHPWSSLALRTLGHVAPPPPLPVVFCCARSGRRGITASARSLLGKHGDGRWWRRISSWLQWLDCRRRRRMGSCSCGGGARCCRPCLVLVSLFSTAPPRRFLLLLVSVVLLLLSSLIDERLT